jgi:hypothetical protein
VHRLFFVGTRTPSRFLSWGVLPEKSAFLVTAPQSNDPKYLHQRAEEARAHVRQITNARDKEMMLEIANENDDLAE